MSLQWPIMQFQKAETHRGLLFAFPLLCLQFFGCTSNENLNKSFPFHLPLLILYLSRFFCCCAVLFMWAFAWVSFQRIFLTNLLLMAWGFRGIYWKHIIRFQAACREEGDLGSKLQMLWAVTSGNICHNLEYARCRKLLPRLGPIKWDIYNFRLLPAFPEGKQLRDCC